MRPSRIILLSVLLSTLIAIVISYLPNNVLSNSNKNEVSVFQWKILRPVVLTEDKIVDFINNQSLSHPIKYVEWNNNRLSIDIAYSAMPRPREAYSDFLSLVHAAFMSTENVEFLLLRLYDEAFTSKPLALSLLISRDDAIDMLDKVGKLRTGDMEDFLIHTMGVKQTQHWIKSLP